MTVIHYCTFCRNNTVVQVTMQQRPVAYFKRSGGVDSSGGGRSTSSSSTTGRSSMATSSSSASLGAGAKQQAPVTSSGKLPVAPPTSLGKFGVILAMHVCKKILLIDPMKRMGYYLCIVTVLSLVTDLFPVPRSYFSDKRNILNVYFVKF